MMDHFDKLLCSETLQNVFLIAFKLSLLKDRSQSFIAALKL